MGNQNKNLILHYFLIFIFLSFFIGCFNSKKYFSPKKLETNQKHKISNKYVIQTNGQVALMNNGNILSKSKFMELEGIKLSKNDEVINIIGDKAIIINKYSKKSKILDIKSNKSIYLKTPFNILSCSIFNKIYLAYVLENNSFGIYNLKSKQNIYLNRQNENFIIDYRVANPLQIDNIIMFPMLDGKVIIFNMDNLKIIKEVYVSTEDYLNNVTFLEQLDNSIVVSTNYKTIIMNESGIQEYKNLIYKVLIHNKSIFIFGKDGTISKFNKNLKTQKIKKIQSANFIDAVIYENKIHILEKEGFLIEIDLNLNNLKVYKAEEVENIFFSTPNKFYFDKNIITL